MEGWVKLYREIMNDAVWQTTTPEQKTVLIVLLLMANHKENEWEWEGVKFKVAPGQFVTSIDSIKRHAGKGVSTQNIRTALSKLEKLGFLTNQSTKTGRLITIVNWGKYQGCNTNPNKDDNKELTNNSQRANNQLTPNKNVRMKEGKNNYTEDFEEFWGLYPRKVKKPDAFKRWNARLKEGHTNLEMVNALKEYLKEIRENGTEKKFIKHPSTFIGPSKDFKDYIKTEQEVSEKKVLPVKSYQEAVKEEEERRASR